MSTPPDDGKRLLNEVLPDPTAATERQARSPRARTAEHLRRILAVGLLTSDLAGCGSSEPPTPPPPPPPKLQPSAPVLTDQPRPRKPWDFPGAGYLVVDMIPSPPPPQPLGFLHLESTPVAAIFIDGKVTSLKTPQTRLSLRAGPHTIRLEAEDGRLVDTFDVEITAGVLQRTIRDLRGEGHDK